MWRNRFLGSVSPMLMQADDGTSGGGAAVDPADVAPAAADGADPAAGAGAGAGAGEAASAAASGAPDPAAAKPPQRDWRDKEIGRKHAQLKTAEAENIRLREQLEAMARRGADPAAGDPAADRPSPAAPARAPAADTAHLEARIDARAREIAAAQSAEDQLSTAFDVGRKAHGDAWDSAIENIKTLGGFDPDTMMGVLATDDPAKVLYEVGSDPSKYHRLLELPPAKRLAEIIKLGMAAPTAPAPKKAVSDAPAPVEPVRSNATSGSLKYDLYDQRIAPGSWDKSPFEAMKADSDRNDDQWYAARQREKAASKGRPWSPQQR